MKRTVSALLAATLVLVTGGTAGALKEKPAGLSFWCLEMAIRQELSGGSHDADDVALLIHGLYEAKRKPERKWAKRFERAANPAAELATWNRFMRLCAKKGYIRG